MEMVAFLREGRLKKEPQVFKEKCQLQKIKHGGAGKRKGYKRCGWGEVKDVSWVVWSPQEWDVCFCRSCVTAALSAPHWPCRAVMLAERDSWSTGCMYECVKCAFKGKSPWKWVGWVKSDNRWEGFAAQCSWLEVIILHCPAQLPALESELPLSKFPVLAKRVGTFLGALCQNVFLWWNLLWQSNCSGREGLTNLLKTRQNITWDCARLPHSSADMMPSWPAAALWLQCCREGLGALWTPDFQTHVVQAGFVCMPVVTLPFWPWPGLELQLPVVEISAKALDCPGRCVSMLCWRLPGWAINQDKNQQESSPQIQLNPSSDTHECC